MCSMMPYNKFHLFIVTFLISFLVIAEALYKSSGKNQRKVSRNWRKQKHRERYYYQESKKLSNSATQDVNSYITSVYNDVNRPPWDQRAYRGLLLKNGLKMLLISDPNAEISAFSIQVNAGFIDDPIELMGLAHLTEHVILRGSEKYPDRYIFTEFAGKVGSSAAATGNRRVAYNVFIESNQIENALDRFAHGFISALFNETQVHEEVSRVSSEFDRSMTTDPNREMQVLRTLLDYSTPGYHPFIAGNRKTLADAAKKLNIKLHLKVKEFFETHYSSNVISLVLLAPQNLENITKFIVPLYAQIKNRNLAKFNIKSPFGSKFVGHRVKMASIEQDKMWMVVLFPIPLDLRVEYRHKIFFYYMDKFFNDEKPGSFETKLKELGLITNFIAHEAPEHVVSRGSELYRCRFELTAEGFKNVDTILKRFFAFIASVKERTNINSKWVYDEIKIWKMNEFATADVHDSLGWTIYAAQKLADGIEFKHVLDDDIKDEPFDPEFIKRVLSFFNASNANVLIGAKNFTDNLDKVEEYSGVKYRVDRMPQNFIQELEQQRPLSETDVKFPTVNPYIPKHVRLPEATVGSGTTIMPEQPTVVLADENKRLWYKKDMQKFLMQANFIIRSPIQLKLLKETMLQTVFVNCLTKHIPLQITDAIVAKYGFKISKTIHSALYIEMEGFEENMNLFLRNIFKMILTWRIDNTAFNTAKNEIITELNGLVCIPHLQQFLDHIFYSDNFLIEQRLNATRDLSLEDLHTFQKRLFLQFHIEGFLYGSLDQAAAIRLFSTAVNDIQNIVKQKPIFTSEVNYNRRTIIPTGQSFRIEKMTCYLQTMTVLILQWDSIKPHSSALNILLKRSLVDKFPHLFITGNEATYLESANVNAEPDANRLILSAISAYHPCFVESKIENFVNGIKDVISQTSEQEFNQIKNELIEEFKALHTQTYNEKSAEEIASGEYFFKRNKILAIDIATITKSELMTYAHDISRGSVENYRKLSIFFYIQGNMRTPDNWTCPKKNVILINNTDEFKGSLVLQPGMKHRLFNLRRIGV